VILRGKKKRLRIVMLGQKHALSNEGGVEVAVREVSTRMATMGHKVTCYNRSGHHVSGREHDGNWQRFKEYRGVQMRTVPTLHKRGLAAVTSSFFAALFAAFGRYDVVHFHAEGPCAMMWIPKLFRKRCIATIHGIDWKRAKWARSIGMKYIKFSERCAVRFADEIIVLSENVQKYFLETYGRETVFIPNGVNRPKVREADRIKERWGLEKDSYILFLGRLVPEKGLQYLVEAYGGLMTDKKLVIAGGSSDTVRFMENLRKSCRGFRDHVIFTGFVRGEILDELFSNAYVYVLPSDLEGMPISLLEAMSYGNCCVVSDIEECVSVVEDEAVLGNEAVADGTDRCYKAIIFKKGNASDLRDKLQMLCDDEKLVQGYKAETADFICGKYNWDEIVKRILKLYREDENYTKSVYYAENKNQVMDDTRG